MSDFLQDVRFALRQLLRWPGAAAVMVLTLGLGIGANTAIFSAVNGVLLRPLPSPDLDRIHVIRQDLYALNLLRTELAAGDVEDLAAREDVFAEVAGLIPTEWNLTGTEEPVRLAAALTIGDFFEVFQVRPYLGRVYDPGVSHTGEDAVVVLSYAAWQQLTGGDPAVVGRTLELNGEVREVIGVLPRDFRYPRGTEIYKPVRFRPEWRDQRGRLNTLVLARIQPGVTPEQLASQLDAQVQEWGGAREDRGLHATPLVEHLAGPLRPILLVLMGAVGLVLLIACANVASLQLVRATRRVREMAVRRAIGATPRRLVRQFLAESLVLAVLGGAVGLGIGRLVLEVLSRWDPAQQRALEATSLDLRVLLFTLLVSLVAAVLFGTAPTIRAARVQPQQAFREASQGGGRQRQRLLTGSVVVQVALALVLLIGSGLMIRSLAALLGTDTGIDTDRVLTAQVTLPGDRYENVAQQTAFYDELTTRLESTPGIAAAGVGWALPFSDQIRDSSPLGIPGRPAQPGDPQRHAEYRVVSGSYFRALGIPLLSGRLFDSRDHWDAPRTVLVDRRFAERFFPGEDPVGQQIVHGRGEATIIGVVGTVDHAEVAEEEGKPLTYYHYPQTWSAWMGIAVRTRLHPQAAIATLRSAVRGIDPQLPLYDIATMDQRIQRSLGDRRLAAATLTGFGLLALVLAMLGVYGVLRHSIELRRREIGIRVALGASGRQVMRLVIGHGFALVGLGLAFGIAGALVLTRLIAGLLHGVQPTDPLTFAAVVVLLLTTGVFAAWLPARRAARVDPMIELRSE